MKETNGSPVDFRRLRLELCWAYLGEPLHGPVQRILNPQWNSAWFVETGAVDVECQGERRRAVAGEFMLPRLTSRVQEFAPGTRLCSVGFIARWTAGWPLVDFGETWVLRGEEARALGRASRSLVRLAGGEGSRGGNAPEIRTAGDYCEVQREFFGWMARLLAAIEKNGLELRMAPSDPAVERVLTALERWPLDRGFRLQALAEEAGVGTRRMQQILKGKLGTSAREYLDRRRVELAVRELRTGMRSMKEISALTGFRFEANFSLWFKRRRGQSPREYRKQGLTL